MTEEADVGRPLRESSELRTVVPISRDDQVDVACAVEHRDDVVEAFDPLEPTSEQEVGAGVGRSIFGG